MNLPEPVQPKKTNNQVWIIVVVVIVLLCCILVATLTGVYIYLKQSGMLASLLPGIVPSPVATEVAVTEVPPVISGPLVVEPFDPMSNNYPTLQESTPNWSDMTSPGSKTWPVTIARNHPVMLFLGWCTTTPELLDQNYQHITFKLIVDGQPVDVHGLYTWSNQESDRVCRTFVGLIRQWTGSEHTIVTTMSLDKTVNDGWDNYPAGDYIETFNVTVSP